MRHRAKKLSPLIILQMLARAQRGESSADIAEAYGVDKSTLNRWRSAFLRTPKLRKQLRAARSSIDTLMVSL